MNEQRVLKSISFEKDVDGFSAQNVGELAMKGGTPSAMACTPLGCMEILKRSGVDISGKKACVVGRSNIVGMPVALMLLHANATVTICHSRTPDIAEQVGQADIVVAAIGKPRFVQGSWLKEGAIVLDVGINRIEGGYLVGDVDESARERAGMLTPVPGGVGPMTIAMLLQNTLGLARRAAQREAA